MCIISTKKHAEWRESSLRVAIFSTDTGQGHNCASKAVQEVLIRQGVDAQILNVLNAGKQKSKTISRLYDGLVNRVPALFGALYALAERISSPTRHSPIYYLNALYAASLGEAIAKLDPQVIVCPHMFSAHAVTRLIDKYGLKIPTVGIITDYSCSPFWEESRLDAYVVASPEVAEECASRGMERARLHPIGIPVGEKFNRRTDKRAARAALGIEGDKVIVVMGGSMGYGRIPETAERLAQAIPDAQVIAVCGTNTCALEKAKNIPRVTALPFIEHIDVLMDAADVLLTKPGGLSATEAMAKRVPLVITMPIPGGEVRNAQFIERMGMAVTANSPAAAASAACALMRDACARVEMIAAQEAHYDINSAEKIAELILKMVKGT